MVMVMFDPLTQTQREPLFEMVRFQLAQKADVAFFSPPGALYISVPNNHFGVMPPHNAVQAWQQFNYVIAAPGVMGSPGKNGQVITLLQPALEYYLYYKKPPLWRWLLRQRAEWRSETKAAVVSLITAVITTYLLRLINLA